MKILFKTIFGSHLYGTNSETSDHDYKGVFMESIDAIILKRDRTVILNCTKPDKGFGIRNTKDDVDTEFKEVRRFLHDCQQGQTYALDMLFTPEKFWLERSSAWEYIINCRHKLLSKNVKPYIGYIRQQTGKYGLKGSRLGELLRVIDYLKMFDIKQPLYSILNDFQQSEFAKVVEITNERPHGETSITETFLEVLGKKFQSTRLIKDVLPSLEKLNSMYGGRAKLAMQNEGVDWKAVSHAFRCCYQLIELAKTHRINFPLEQAEKN